MFDSARISVLLASDFPILSESLLSIFKGTQDIHLEGCAGSEEELVQQMGKFRPDVVLVDISITCDKFSALLSRIRKFQSKILVINQDLSPAQTIDALRCGADGVIGRKTTAEILCKSVRTVICGDIWVDREVTTELVNFLRIRNSPAENVPVTPKSVQAPTPVPTDSEENRFGLTKRELQIVNALVEAQTNRDMAETFGISEYTVKHHLTSIFDKLGVYNRVELALFAINHKLCAGVPVRV
jgi:two-component system nitrate/nitrite response regulator NarL